MENHEYGLPPSHYQKWPVLSQWYDVLTTTKDRNGLEYVSTVEARRYPFTGTQWHPEKPTSGEREREGEGTGGREGWGGEGTGAGGGPRPTCRRSKQR